MRIGDVLNETPQSKSGGMNFNSPQMGMILPKSKMGLFKNQWIRPHKSQHCYLFSENTEEYYYLAVEIDEDSTKIIGIMKLESFKIKGYINSYQVTESEIHSEYRGNGFSKFFYEQLIKRKHMTLVSDYSQYDGARNVWTSLSKKFGIDIYDEHKHEVIEKDYKLTGRDEKKVYGDNKNKILLILKENSMLEDL